MKSSLEITGRKGEWYVVDPLSRMPDCGPYSTKEEADDDRQGLERFWRDNPTIGGGTVRAPEGMLF